MLLQLMNAVLRISTMIEYNVVPIAPNTLQARLFLWNYSKLGGYRKMLEGCKLARCPNLLSCSLKKQKKIEEDVGKSVVSQIGGSLPPPHPPVFKNITGCKELFCCETVVSTSYSPYIHV